MQNIGRNKTLTLGRAGGWMVMPLAVVLMAGTWSVARAGDQDAKRKTEMHQLDANQDNFVTREEAKSDPKVMEYFDDLDVDKDGKLSEEEFMAIDETVKSKTKPVYLSDSFDKLDADGNGKLSREELDADSSFSGMFDEMDMNKDSAIEKSEATDYDEQTKKKSGTS